MTPSSHEPAVWINGRITAAAEATLSIFDRSFLYGDGLFETVRIHHGAPFLWEGHWKRLAAGASVLRIQLPFREDEIANATRDLIQHHGLTEGILRITVSRGDGLRGYSPRGANHPRVILTLHRGMPLDVEQPVCWKLATSRFRVSPGDPLTQLKSANKLLQVLARAEAEEAGANEALLLNSHGDVAEAAAGNVFWIDHGAIITPPPHAGALPGVTRAFILELARRRGLPAREQTGPVKCLQQAEGVFVTLSSQGIVSATHLDGVPLRSSPVTERLWRDYLEAVNSRPLP